MTDSLDLVVATKADAHHAAHLAYQYAQALILDGKRVRIMAREQQDSASLQQKRFYFGPVLGDISRQARIDGKRYVQDAWHQLLKMEFLGYEIKEYQVAGNKFPVVERKLRSVRDLGIKEMSEYLDKVQAHMATEYGVEFNIKHWKEYQS